MHPLTLCVHDLLRLMDIPMSSPMAEIIQQRLLDFQQTTLATNRQSQLKQWKAVSTALAPHILPNKV